MMIHHGDKPEDTAIFIDGYKLVHGDIIWLFYRDTLKNKKHILKCIFDGLYDESIYVIDTNCTTLKFSIDKIDDITLHTSYDRLMDNIKKKDKEVLTMKKTLTCNVCGNTFYPDIIFHYVSRGEEPTGMIKSIGSSSEPKLYDCFDCPNCGCQVEVQVRKRVHILAAAMMGVEDDSVKESEVKRDE